MPADISFEQFRGTFFNFAETAQAVAITSHISPDDDSIASVLSLYVILKEKFPEKNIRILYTGEKVSRYSMFTNFGVIEFVDDIANHLGETDLLIMLDASQYARFSKQPEVLKKVAKTIAIDHHSSEPNEFSLLLYRKEFSSNAELIYRAFFTEGQPVSKPLAELFLLGVLGDTGNFAYINPSQSEVFLLAKKLVEIVGVQIDDFRTRYGGMQKRAFELTQVLMKNTQYNSLSGWPDFQYTFIDRSVLEEGNYSDEEISEASHRYLSSYLPRVIGYSWGFVITPRSDGACRISSRSQSVNVRDFHERLGIGGGHDRASGGFIPLSDPKEYIQRILEWMKTHEPVIL